MIRPALADLDLLVFDFDGVLTDNRVLIMDDGREAVFCSRADGLGFDALRAAKLDTVILSTEINPVVSARAKKLQLTVKQGLADKALALMELLRERNTNPARVAYIGNDINDLAAMKTVGWPIAPADANPAIIVVARLVTDAKGGAGVARELAEILLGADFAEYALGRNGNAKAD